MYSQGGAKTPIIAGSKPRSIESHGIVFYRETRGDAATICCQDKPGALAQSSL